MSEDRLEIWNRSQTPHGGWHYDQRLLDGSLMRVTGVTYADLKKKVRSARRNNGIESGDLDGEIAMQLCGKPQLQGWCRPARPAASAAVIAAQLNKQVPKTGGCSACGSKKTR